MVSTAVLLTRTSCARNIRACNPRSTSTFKEKRFEPAYGAIFDHSRKYREGADYKSWRFTHAKAEQIVADCEKFFARMERYLREIGALE